MAVVPPLERGSGSWVVVSKATGMAVLETYSRTVAESVNPMCYEVFTAGQYLASLNRCGRDRETD